MPTRSKPIWANILFAAAILPVDPNLGTLESNCKTKDAAKQVLIFKQWHLAPNVNTVTPSQTQLPQAENQTAIYQQLDKWILDGKLNIVIAEGCGGELNETSEIKFNGWSYAELKAASEKPGFAQIVSHVPLKLEAKYGDKVKTLCGDDLALIKSHNLAFSDARGIVGFSARLKQYRHTGAAKSFLDEVIRLYKLPKTTTLDAALIRLGEELRKVVVRIKEGITKRNKIFLKRIKTASNGDLAVVIGGAHVSDLVQKLDEEGIACQVIRPPGYTPEMDKILEELTKMANLE